MRYILLFVLIASAITVFILADYFPRLLEHYPMLQEANWTVREWLGMETPRSSGLSEQNLEEADRILREESSKKTGAIERGLSDYHE